MVAVDELNSWTWADRGTRPLPADAVYNPGYQPIAGYDNHWNWSLSKDVHNLHDRVGGLDDVFVNTNRPDSTESMEGPLSVPKLRVRGAEGLEVFGEDAYWPDGVVTDANTFRAIDDNDNKDVGFLLERYFPGPDGDGGSGAYRSELLSVREPQRVDNFHYKEEPVWYGDTVGTAETPVDGTLDAASIGDTVVPPADADIQSFVDAHSGDVIDLAGRTFEVSSPLSVADYTTVRNGTIKLAKGADSDLFYRKDPIRLKLIDITWDFGGNTNTGSPDNEAYWTLDDTGRTGRYNMVVRNEWTNYGDRAEGGVENAIKIKANESLVDTMLADLNSGADIIISSRQQLIVRNPILINNHRINFRGQDGSVSGGTIEYNDVACAFRDGSVGDWTLGGGLIIEDNRMGVYVDAPIKQYNNISIRNVQFQGQTERAVVSENGGATTGRLVLDGATFKRQYFENGGPDTASIDIQSGYRVTLKNLDATNNRTDDATKFIRIGTGAENTIVEGINADSSDFSGAIINNQSASTALTNGTSQADVDSSQAFDPGTETVVRLTAATADELNGFEQVANSFVAPADGKYTIQGSARLETNGTPFAVELFLYKNENILRAETTQTAGISRDVTGRVQTGNINLNGGDELQLRLNQHSSETQAATDKGGVGGSNLTVSYHGESDIS